MPYALAPRVTAGGVTIRPALSSRTARYGVMVSLAQREQLSCTHAGGLGQPSLGGDQPRGPGNLSARPSGIRCHLVVRSTTRGVSCGPCLPSPFRGDRGMKPDQPLARLTIDGGPGRVVMA